MDPQHKLFADTYLAKRNATEAAITAGYSKKTARVQGCKMLRYPHIEAYIADHDKKTVSKVKKSVSATQAWKKKKLIKIILKLTKKSELTAISAKPVISAIAELNKMDGHYSAEKVVNTNLNIDTDLQKVAEESRKSREVLDKYRSEY